MYLLSGLESPWNLFPTMTKLLESLDFAMKDHILPRHMYKTDEEAEKYRMQNNDKYIKSRFSDGLDDTDIFHLIILAILHPTKVTPEYRVKHGVCTWAIAIDKR